MALEKDIETVYGVNGNYHKITRMDLNTLDWSAIVYISIWKDSTARQESKSPLKAMEFNLPSGSLNPANLNNTCMIDFAYDWIKTNIEFYQGAIDV